jgi:hypothetical protein
MKKEDKLNWLIDNVTKPTVKASIDCHPEIKKCEEPVKTITSEMLMGVMVGVAMEVYTSFEDEDLLNLVSFYKTETGQKTIRSANKIAKAVTDKVYAIEQLAKSFEA